jgi:hypothetical protein
VLGRKRGADLFLHHPSFLPSSVFPSSIFFIVLPPSSFACGWGEREGRWGTCGLGPFFSDQQLVEGRKEGKAGCEKKEGHVRKGVWMGGCEKMEGGREKWKEGNERLVQKVWEQRNGSV